MKRILILICACALLSACGEKETTANQTTEISMVALLKNADEHAQAMKESKESDPWIKVTGSKDTWTYEFIRGEGAGIKHVSVIGATDSANEIVFPMNRQVRLMISSDDVVRVWEVNALGAKRDAIPGYELDVWLRPDKPGYYRGTCTKDCAPNDGPILVRVASDAEYSAWVRTKNASSAENKKD